MSIKSSRHDIHRQLREEIILLELPPGSRLREEHLARQFGVSRTPIRQVLDRLEFEGLVDMGEGRGAVVSSLDPKALRDTWAVRLRIAELVGDFVTLPAPPMTLERISEIRVQLDRVRATRDIKLLGSLYNRFHEALLEVVSNSALRRIQDLLYVQTARVWMEFLPEMDLDEEIDIMAEEVDQVLRVMHGHSGAELSAVRTEHMRRLLKRFNEQVTATRAVPA